MSFGITKDYFATTQRMEEGGSSLWLVFNALATLVLLTLIFIGIYYGLNILNGINEVKQNWNKYRCDPSIMPFASFYGHNTLDNFNYCMGNIFNVQSVGLTAPFANVMGKFTGVLGVLLGAANGMRTSIATMGGGINVIFQEFVDRLTTFFFQLRQSAIRMKTLMTRMYATMFAVVYMGTSAITGVQSFGNTVLFSFLDTFCFEPSTHLEVERNGISTHVPIADIQIGDILLPTRSRVTAKFHFSANGQPMIRLPRRQNSHYPPIYVSSNHYLLHNNTWIRSEEHPNASAPQPYEANSLLCLNTSDHTIPIDGYLFRDYDETEDNCVDDKTMQMIEDRVNGNRYQPLPQQPQHQSKPYTEYFPSMKPSTRIRLANGDTEELQSIPLGTKLSTGCTVIGKVQREIHEYCSVADTHIASSTLVWNSDENQWKRIGSYKDVQKSSTPVIYISLFVTPSSVIELHDGTVVRDSIELCSPDAEIYYAEQLRRL